MPLALLLKIDWGKIYLPFAEKCFELVARCQARGFEYYATSGFRTPEEQLALWQLGRNEDGAVTDPKKVVTKLRYGAHNAGIAVDFSFDAGGAPGLQPSWDASKYEVLAEEAERLNLEAGHRWKHFPDSPHIQLPISKKNITFSMLRGRYEATGKLSSPWHLLDKCAPW